MSRTNCPIDHVSAEAEPAGLPLTKPIDAIVGSVPNGERARSGRSHACSGIRPTPEPIACIARSRSSAAPGSPVSISYCPRSPASTGQRCPLPLPVGAHGRPSVERSP